jgi:succinate dehydrogenase/fumarate reductase-like Fe-S protein
VSQATIKVSVLRSGGGANRTPYYQTYEVPKSLLGQTVLEVLEYIFENIDSSLAFAIGSCRRGYCSTCVAVVNDRPGLACTRTVTGDVKIRPPDRFQVIRDLVIRENKR